MVTSLWKTNGEEDNNAHWAADFEDGDLRIQYVDVSLQMKNVNAKNNWFVFNQDGREGDWVGIEVYIGSELCGTIGKEEGQFWL